jgi:hypothetical protein
MDQLYSLATAMRMTQAAAVPWTDPTLVISLDLELAWGSFDHAYGSELLEMARWTHDRGAPELLAQLTRNGLRATWAVVGVACHDRLPDVSTLTPWRLPAGGDWFSRVPAGATEESAPEWFGASLVRILRAARPAQEVGFHGWSHVVLGDRRVPRERARQELAECGELARHLGIIAPSFVFPRNRVGHLDALRDAGFACYRGPDVLPWGLRSDLPRRLFTIGADALGLAPRVVAPRLVDGLVEVPGSMMVRWAGGWRRLIPDASRLRRLRGGLRRVRERGGILHVWLHPENLFFARPRLARVLEDFFAETGELAATARLRVLTMGEVAGAVRARAGELSAGAQGGRVAT